MPKREDRSDARQSAQGEETINCFAHPSWDKKSGNVIVTLFGGQGTIKEPSWSPDSTRLAFVSYRLVGK